MNVTTVSLPEITIIGKQGFCTKENNVAQGLWKEANAHFNEIASLGMKEKNGSYVGFWGAMSDETMAFLPWTDNFSRGYYLAGIEASSDAKEPDGWTKWVMPARTYLKVLLDLSQYTKIFQNVINNVIPDMNMKLSGAVCEYIEPATGTNYLLFPVEKI